MQGDSDNRFMVHNWRYSPRAFISSRFKSMGKANVQITANRAVFTSVLDYRHTEMGDVVKINVILIKPAAYDDNKFVDQ